MRPTTLFEKLWDAHLVDEGDGISSLLYVDRHLIYEVTSPQAFEGLRLAGRELRRPSTALATVDHNVSTIERERLPEMDRCDPLSRIQIQQLDINCREFGVTLYGLTDPRQGIIHVIGPEQGATLPGMSIVAGDSHTSTHGAFAALAFGIGTSEVEHVLATQCLWVLKPKTMEVRIDGELQAGVSAKDLILHVIASIGPAGAAGHAIEFTGTTVRSMSMEARMTLCNMSIEAGAKVGLIAVDDKTTSYLKDRPSAPSTKDWDRAVSMWANLKTDLGASYDRSVHFDAALIAPMVSWGTSPEMTLPINANVPEPSSAPDEKTRLSIVRALQYMNLEPGTPIASVILDKVFIGSCTNARIEDLRLAADQVRGKHIASSIRQALVVPGSGLVKAQAEKEGLDVVFKDAGFEWRAPGCSMCLGMNDDHLRPNERCASTSNRNFEGRQGAGGRTHLVSPAMAAAAAIAGHFVDIRQGSAS